MESICFFYVIYSIYTVFVVTVSDYKVYYALFGLIFIWMIFLSYYIGYMVCKRNLNKSLKLLQKDNVKFLFSNIADWNTRNYLLNGFICIIFSIIAGKYYTGRGFFDVITGIFSGKSAYAIYQSHMSLENIGVFRIEKIPFIIMRTFYTIMLFWGTLGIILNNKKIKFNQIVYLFLIILAYLYFGISRGTNFEMYSIFIIIVYCILNNNAFSCEVIGKYKIKGLFISICLCLIAVLIFRVVVSARGVFFNNQICTEINFNPDSIVARYFPTITNIGLSVFNYLGYGIFSIGVTVKEIIFGSLKSFVASVIPYGYFVLYGQSFQSIIRATLDVGGGWVSDGLILINYFGFILTFFIIFLFGIISSYSKFSQTPKLLSELINTFIFIEMLSIPIGNFLVVSSPHMLTLFLICIWWFIWFKCRIKEIWVTQL